jgi:hypothetical protein
MFCLAPVILMGYLFTMQPNQAHVSNVDGAMVEMQSCEKGLGAHARIQFAGLYSAGLHYGFQYRSDDGLTTVTFQPRAGLSYSSIPRWELPAEKQFELGAQLMFGYGQWRVGLDYWHLSNAGLKEPNIGIDMIGIVTGWSF